MRFIFKSFLFLLLFFVCCAGYLLITTEKGLQMGVHYATLFTDDKLKIKNVTGKLNSHFILSDISYQDENIEAIIDTIDLSWKPAGLLVDKFVVDKLIIKNAIIKLLNNKPSSTLPVKWLSYIAIKDLMINHLSIAKENAYIELTGHINNKWNMNWHLSVPQINLFLPESTGALLGSGTISGNLKTPSIHANFASKKLCFMHFDSNQLNAVFNVNLIPQTDSTLSLTGSGIKIYNHSINDTFLKAFGNLTKQHNSLLANLKIIFANKYHIATQINLPKFTQFTDLDQPIIGKVNFNSLHLEWLASFIPHIKNLSGSIQGNVLINGTLGQPTITSHIEFNHGQCEIPLLGIALEKIELNTEPTLSKQLIYQGTFVSGTGVGKIHGNIDFSQPNFSTQLSLIGTNVQIVNLPEYKITASPNITISSIDNNFQIQGDIDILSAEITPKNFTHTVTLPSEVIFIDTPSVPNKVFFPITTEVNLHLKNKIHLIYNDLQAYLRGNIQISHSPNGTILATGELYTNEGTYDAYGQVLSIQDGRLFYTGGSLLNPGIDIRAAKEIKIVSLSGKSNFSENISSLTPIYTGSEIVTVGIQIEGTFNNPRIALFSNPAGLSQNDILSYLTFGHPNTESTAQQSKMILSAVSALNFTSKGKFPNLTDKLQKTLGLSEMSVESTEVFNTNLQKTSTATSFVIGKQISSNLYVHYSMGIFEPISTLNLRYQLNKHFAIQSETSSIGNGADLLYSIERD